jgi:hypothetical protein
MHGAWRLIGPWSAAVGVPAAIGLIGYGYTTWQPVVCLILLANVVVLALWSGARAALLAAAVGALVVNICFTTPVGSLRVSDHTGLAVLSIYIAMAVGVSAFLNREVARELAARSSADRRLVHAGDLVIDLDRRVVTKAGDLVPLTPTEWAFLALLAQKVGTLVPRDEVLRIVWGPAYLKESHYLRVYVAQLRRKLEDDPANPKIILTSPGQGYILQP